MLSPGPDPSGGPRAPYSSRSIALGGCACARPAPLTQSWTAAVANSAARLKDEFRKELSRRCVVVGKGHLQMFTRRGRTAEGDADRATIDLGVDADSPGEAERRAAGLGLGADFQIAEQRVRALPHQVEV